MVWTKLKKTAESLLADSLRGRVEYHLARYGNGLSYIMRRGWIVFDKRQVANFSTIKWIRKLHEQTGKWYSNDEQDLARLGEDGLFTRDDFVDGLDEYVGLKVEDAIKSSKPIVRAIAMFDRRFGKRRLNAMSVPDGEIQLVKDFYKIRMRAEGLESEPHTA